MTVLRVDDLTKSFGGIQAVRGVGFDLAAGELLAMIGPNGAGKSTCFNILNGQLRPDTGSVSLLGIDITGRPPRAIWRRGVGRTFQITATFVSMTVRENVQMALLSRHRRLRNLFGRAERMHVAEADDLLAALGLAADADRPCGVLAYGDLKRVELALALANRPKLLLMDEPTAGMAPGERTDLMALTARLAKERDIAVLFTEHDMDAVFRYADRIVVLSRGRIIAEGTPDEVRANDEVKAVYLGQGTTFGSA
jgi:branched-chain amino acid transport system ATP-binding protein